MDCKYGCNQPAVFTLKNGSPCCSKSSNSCEANKLKNSKGTKAAHSSGNKGYTYNPKSAWSTGKTSLDDSRIISSYDSETLFAYNSRGPHKKVLINERGHQCESCLNTNWLGKPITLELEHSDGDSLNNIRENLKLLCPNCHRQTKTWRRRKSVAKNISNAKWTDEQMKEAIETSENLHQCLRKLELKWGSYKTIENFRTKHNLLFGSAL